ncbi:MAG TPA: hypothetical protein VNP72_08870, partial [Longimicrobium sp.]|nr:hypothetical protein [Longimicrobium sp.]
PGERGAWEPLGTDGIAGFAATRPEGEEADPGIAFRGTLPLCLRRLPEPAAVAVREGEGRRPLQVEWGTSQKPFSGAGMEGFPPALWKTRSEGPERISGGWWAGGDAREYWRVESPEGWLGLLFRDAGSGRWYLEGWYD